jgi:hypothetical protein
VHTNPVVRIEAHNGKPVTIFIEFIKLFKTLIDFYKPFSIAKLGV